MRRLLFTLAAGLFVVFLLAQLVPYGRSHTNPPVRQEPPWDSPRTRELAVRACFDCHSNETTWPWYSNVAPLSWLVQRDVDEGREELNLSEWGGRPEEGDDAAETVRDGRMPPLSYVFLHPSANLSAAERQELARGLTATLGQVGEAAGREGGGDEERAEDEDDD